MGAGTRVAYLDRSSPEVVELLFAASKVGAVLVPLNWRLAPPELAAVLADAQAPVLIAGPAFREVAEDVRASGCRRPDLVVVGEGYERWLAAHEPRDPGGRGAAGDVIVQMYTSGTTGVPKGVLTTHGNLAMTAQTSSRWAIRRALRQPHPAADVPHRRDRVGVLRPLARRHHRPGQRVRCRRASSTSSSAGA